MCFLVFGFFVLFCLLFLLLEASCFASLIGCLRLPKGSLEEVSRFVICLFCTLVFLNVCFISPPRLSISVFVFGYNSVSDSRPTLD